MPPQQLAPPTVFHALDGHVSYPNSPGCGMVWKIQRRFPVRAAKARMWPGAPGAGPSSTTEPRIDKGGETNPGEGVGEGPTPAGPGHIARKTTRPYSSHQ